MMDETKEKVLEIKIFISEDGSVSDDFGYSHNFLRELRKHPDERKMFIDEFLERLNKYIDNEFIGEDPVNE
jgi:hypothetical protein